MSKEMSLKHNGHTHNDYLDDNDFVELANRLTNEFRQQKVSKEDFEEPEFKENLIDQAREAVMDFVAYEAVNFFGYKYGELYGRGYLNVAEQLIDYVEKQFKT